MAFVYPIISLLLIWSVTGQNTSGISGLLPGDIAAWQRAAVLGALCVSGVFFYAFVQTKNQRQWVYLAVAFAYIQEGMSRRGRQGLFYLLYVPLMLLILVIVALYSQNLEFRNTDAEQEFKPFLIFLVLLPLVNSVFDWLSLAATRWLLRHIAKGQYSTLHIAAKALFDLGIGLVLLVALALTCTAALQTMNLLAHVPGKQAFFDLTGLLHRIRTAPGNPAVWWVYFTLFSTLLPTLVHAIIAAGSFLTWRLPEKWRDHWQDILTKHDLDNNHCKVTYMARRLTALDATAVILGFLAVAVPVSLLLVFPHFGWGLLWICEHVAQALGAPIMAGPFIPT
jgi:hypothetical protein